MIQWCGVNDKGRNWLLAMDKKNGSNVWEHDEDFGSWATPVVAKVDGKDQLVVGQSKDVKGKKDPQPSGKSTGLPSGPTPMFSA